MFASPFAGLSSRVCSHFLQSYSESPAVAPVDCRRSGRSKARKHPYHRGRERNISACATLVYFGTDCSGRPSSISHIPSLLPMTLLNIKHSHTSAHANGKDQSPQFDIELTALHISVGNSGACRIVMIYQQSSNTVLARDAKDGQHNIIRGVVRSCGVALP